MWGLGLALKVHRVWARGCQLMNWGKRLYPSPRGSAFRTPKAEALKPSTLKPSRRVHFECRARESALRADTSQRGFVELLVLRREP